MLAMFQVWHKITPNFLDNDDATLAAFPVGFQAVALVECEDAGQVFQLTNHIDRMWWENDGVQKLLPGGVRSTSVGDVFIEISEHPNVRYTIQGMGLKEF